MPILSDETCPPNTTLVDETKGSPVVTNDGRTGVQAQDDVLKQAVEITPEFKDEDCPGAHSGDGCE
jgi:hypothetical protein